MPKNNFLLVDLNETKTRKVAETITSNTSRKILNYLSEKDDTEANISKSLSIAISTVHYHLQKLKEAGLVIVEEFHYSKKGREVNHYKLANKYIIIAPKKVSGLKEKLRGILPVALIVGGVGLVWKLFTSKTSSFQKATFDGAVMEAAMPTTAEIVMETVPRVINNAPDPLMWMLIGAGVTLAMYILIVVIQEKILKNK